MATGAHVERPPVGDLPEIAELADGLGLDPGEFELYGRHKAKIDVSVLDRLATRPDGKLIAVTAVTPTKAGEGKTTTASCAGSRLASARTGRSPARPASTSPPPQR